jgi:hypothetical protein
VIRRIEALLIVWLACGGAHAEPDVPPPPTAEPTPREQARALYHEGIGHAERSEWAEAHARFVRAQELYAAPTNVFNIAQCERALGRYVAALDTFRRFLEMAQGPEHDELRRAAEGFAAELEGRIAWLEVSLTPRDAEMAIDGKPASRGPLALDPGRHTVRVEREGYGTGFDDRDLGPGARAALDLRLERLPAAVAIDADVAGATVLVDGKAVGTVPWRGEIPGGRHRVEVTADGYEAYESTLSVASGGKGELHATLTPEPLNPFTEWWFWTSAAAIVATSAVVTWAATREDPPPADYDGGSLGWVVTAF